MLLFFLSLAQVIYSQDTRLNDGFVISINNEIVGGITAPKLVLVEAGKMRSINIDYIPGDLFFFNPNDKIRLMSDTIGKVENIMKLTHLLSSNLTQA
jgi:hypothetical protein